MTNQNNAERVAIYIDRKNFNTSFKKKGYTVNKHNLIPYEFWKTFNSNILNAYFQKSKVEDNKYFNSSHNHIHHQGTWLFVSERIDFLSKDKIDANELKVEKEFLKAMSKIDSLYGFNIKYGMRSQNGDNVNIKGVDVNIVCHMMNNAFRDNYDVAILLSDNEEFVPAVEMVQDEFGKQVYHMGFSPDRLRATCFGNIPLETGGGYNAWLGGKINNV